MQFLTEPTKFEQKLIIDYKGQPLMSFWFESMQIHLSDVSTAVFVVVTKVNHSYFFAVFFILL